MLWIYIIVIYCACDTTWAKPNFVIFLTDDQDLLLGGMLPLKKVQSLIANNGVEFTNMFVTTPLCCPSRASILTGKYAHNHGVVNNSISGNCNSYYWQRREEPNTFITYLKKSGYSTFYAGKYLNQYGKSSVGGVKHIPPGWDHWAALVGNSCYYNYSMSLNGQEVFHGLNYKKDYFTDVIITEATKFLYSQNISEPFLMFLSPPAPHAPFIPAPQYQSSFVNVSAPRMPNFNIPGGKGKHWLLRQPPSPLPKSVIDDIDEVYRKRWQTLLSVDDGVDKIMQVLKLKKILQNTYIFFTSDNGFHTGQFSLPWDKRQPYEFDVRVPFFIRGPNISAGTKNEHPILNIDLAPTLLELAGVAIPSHFDGESLVPKLMTNTSKTINRTSFIIEHQGEASNNPIPGCPKYKSKEVHTCEVDCICEDSWNNTYSCIRTLHTHENSVICLFKYENFIEVYNIDEDPFQLHNLYSTYKSAKFESPLNSSNILKIAKCINHHSKDILK